MIARCQATCVQCINGTSSVIEIDSDHVHMFRLVASVGRIYHFPFAGGD